jgi:hypothetical protein
MKKYLFIILISFIFSKNVFSQARLGYTEQQIENIFSEKNFHTGYADDGTKYIYTEFNLCIAAYYFNSYGISDMVILIPKTQGNLNALVERYNSQYVIISQNQWKAYLKNGGIITIYLFYNDNGPYFVFKSAN